MEAPVPASALIHSATLVSAGIYLLMRFSFCFEQSPFITALFQLLTAATAFYGALIASFQTDVKKILAYSTISHCGLLMYSITLFRPEVTVFYLFAHGFFKSLNFLCVGNFIQYANNYQDVSRMGGFGVNYRLEFFFLLVTAFNLSSAPLFLAFFSKH
jgi:NADH:ubiquinone oxidoreductase subunit 5 (subunit L)/multisubunit Na+/H+ antiporter MnhA subunit